MGNFWDKMAKSYDKSTEKYYHNANAKTISHTKQYCDKSKDILDLGCGTGIIILDLTDAVNKITAVDASSKMIDFANQKKIKQGIENIDFSVKDISQLDFTQGKYDIITAFNLLLYLTNPEEILKKIYDCLPSGGYFISATDCVGERFLLKTVMKPLSLLRIIPPMNYFTMETLENAFIYAGFKIVFCENLHNMPPNYYVVAKKQ
ncbi:cypemycin methyltransferase [Anaerotignum neopropionicum]|uniref:Cypemycin methyltransferase n=1 Tax=Anaerotignum neopropionicum TaxID=36847 RepID=A0A136WED2_9FIRM|nr:class I SAM-dependent methyltransferase [Anaerotignum neopropionicum]KXL52857.1 cypemycin methyltransferase [Anaerotignum neopropionicum]